MPFTDAEMSEFPLCWIRIEAIGHNMPFLKHAKVQVGDKPVAKAFNGGAEKANRLNWVVIDLTRCVFANEIAGEFVFDGERKSGVQDVIGDGIIAIAKLHEVAEEVGNL